MGDIGDEIAMASIVSRCDQIREAIVLFAQSSDPECITLAYQLITSLRDDYKKRPAIFESFIDDLKMLTKELRGEASRHADVLINEYMQRCNNARVALERKNDLRDVFVEMCMGTDKDKIEFKNSTSCLHAKRTTSLKLPSRQSQEMKDLEQIIIDSGLWEEVTNISGAKIKKVLQLGNLDNEVAKSINEKCSLRESYRLRVASTREELNE